MMATVSLYIPVYNGLQYIEACVNAAFRLTYPVEQFVIVDDASEDGLPEWLQRQSWMNQVQYLRLETRSGIGGVRNAALSVVKTEFIASIDVDCIVSNLSFLRNLTYVIPIT